MGFFSNWVKKTTIKKVVTGRPKNYGKSLAWSFGISQACKNSKRKH